jgi:valyl-tRNA synthetase
VRRAKTEAKVSQRAAVATLELAGPAEWLAAIDAARADLVETLTVGDLVTSEASGVSVTPTLAPPTPPA